MLEKIKVTYFKVTEVHNNYCKLNQYDLYYKNLKTIVEMILLFAYYALPYDLFTMVSITTCMRLL